VKYDPLRAFNSAKLRTALYMFFARRAAGGTGEEIYQQDQVRGSSADSQLLNAGVFFFSKKDD
jgi:hypothetical protein